MKFKIVFQIFFTLCLFSFIELPLAHIKSGLCDPYYASIKSNKVNSHKGPGKEYKVCYEYIQRGTPVMVIAKYDHWRKIRDAEGGESWVHKSLLSPKRFVITISNSPCDLLKEPIESSKPIAIVKKNVVMELISVSGNWCNVTLEIDNSKYKGWIKKVNVFGVFENEIY